MSTTRTTTDSHEQKLVKLLVRELGGKHHVKKFSAELKELGIDLSKTSTQAFVTSPEGAPMLFTLVSYFTFGILNKIVEIQDKIKGN